MLQFYKTDLYLIRVVNKYMYNVQHGIDDYY